MSNVNLSSRLQQVVAQHAATLQAQQSTPRRLPPGALWIAAAILIFLLSIGAGLARLAIPARSAPPNVTPAIINPAIGVAPAPVEAGARPTENAPLTPTRAVAVDDAPAAGPPTYAYQGVRGRAIPAATPGRVHRPPFGAWWANKEYK